MSRVVKFTRMGDSASGLLMRLARDRTGNTLALIAASIFPLLAMIGGGVDMGRTYLTHTRLQQACDAGVLAARKKLGNSSATSLPADVQSVGDRFFGLNFGAGAFGTSNRSFTMTLNTDQSVAGAASVDVPTTIMQLFGYKSVSVRTSCSARLNFSNTDVMFVLDTTGSMADTNPGDSAPKIMILKSVVHDFVKQLNDTKSAGTRVRYGFVPYSTNVNVGTLLKSDWMVNQWTYQSRAPKLTGSGMASYYWVEYINLGGTHTTGSYTSATCPASTSATDYGPTTNVPPRDFWYIGTTNGTSNYCSGNDGNYTVTYETFTDWQVKSYWHYAYDGANYYWTYVYKPLSADVSAIKGATGSDNVKSAYINVQNTADYTTDQPTWGSYLFEGCIEERDTYEINDYSNVDLKKALDLDLDMVPDPNKPGTQWRPQLRNLIFERSMAWDGTGSFTVPDTEFDGDYFNPDWAGIIACPTVSQRLMEQSTTDVDNYLSALSPNGDTYHDIGMIWGGRLLSPTGIFAADNADQPGKPTSRNLIFLTDGITQTFDVDYASYGIEPLDRRRWDPTNPKLGLSLDEVVERRFGVACSEVKKRNITVWVVGFGTTLNPIMTQCAGPGHYFEAKDAAELEATFQKIAAQLGDLRIAK